MTPVAHIAILAVIAAEPQGPCPVRVVPANAPAAWVSAATALERTLHDAATGDRDCREVVVRAGTGSASVEVTTSDGRRGVRRLDDAGDLEATVTALIVTVPADLLSAPAETLARPAPPAPATDAAWRLMLFAGGGGRLTLPSAPSPVLDLMIGALHGRWEAALYGSWVPAVVGAGASARAGFSSSAELGVSGAYRAAFERLDLIAGGRATAIGLWGHADGGDTTGTQTGDNTDTTTTAFVVAPALSAFLGTSIPFVAGVRLRPQVSLQWVSLGITSGDAAASMWSVGLGLGAESGTP